MLTIRIDVHHHFRAAGPDRTEGDRIIEAISTLFSLLRIDMSKLTDAVTELAADVSRQGEVITSAVQVINGLPAVVAAAVADALAAANVEAEAAAAAVEAASAAVEGQTETLRTALTANTPAAPVE